MSSDHQQEFSRTLALFLYWMTMEGYTWTMGDCWRSTDRLNCPHCGKEVTYQGLLVYNKRSKTLQSAHTERRAIDLIVWKDGTPCWDGAVYRPIGEKWEALGGKWGGRFGVPKDEYATRVGWDPGHFEL